MKYLEGNSMVFQKEDKKLTRILLIATSLILSAIVYNLFLLPLRIVTGGAGGIAIITYYLFDIDPSLLILLISISCCIISYMYLGKEKTRESLLVCLLYPVLIKLTENINNWIHLDKSDMILMVLFASLLGGVANGLMYKSGYNRGGLPIISQVLYEKKKIPMVKSNLLIGTVIILIGSIFFGLTNALYAFIFLYINSIVMDKVLLGISNNKAFYIVTTKEEIIKDYIMKHLHHNVTTFSVKGGLEGNDKKGILTVIPTREYYHLKEGIKKIDKDAFFVVMDAYEVEGAK